jgi:hypothetical protein
MKTYLVVTGSIFGLLGIGHLLRLFIELFAEGPHHISANPTFLITSLVIFAIGAGVGLWALLLLRGAAQRAAS